MTLSSNSTTVIQSYLVSSKRHTFANISVSYQVLKRDCSPAGLEVKFSGSTDWGARGAGRLTLKFDRPSIHNETDRAWFGNTSGVALGFDWSDSAAQHPSFQPRNGSLSWPVGSTFSIDPVTISTSTAGLPLGYTYQRNSCYGAGRYWEFFSDGTNELFYSSADAVNWQGLYILRPSTDGNFVAMTCDSSNGVYYVYADWSTKSFYYRYGVLGGDGSISWTIAEQAKSLDGYSVFPSIFATSPSNIWVGFSTTTSPGGGSVLGLEVWKFDGTSWTEPK